jgi:hypothetical protein
VTMDDATYLPGHLNDIESRYSSDFIRDMRLLVLPQNPIDVDRLTEVKAVGRFAAFQGGVCVAANGHERAIQMDGLVGDKEAA